MRIASESYRSFDTGLSGENSASFSASNMVPPFPSRPAGITGS